MNLKKNWPLILGFGLPILMIIAVTASIYLPAAFTRPKYNFLYAYQNFRHCYYQYTTYQVSNGKIEKTVENPPYPPPAPENYRTSDKRCKNLPNIYLHNVKENRSSDISFEQAQKLKLDNSIRSPDGFEVSRGGNGGIFGGKNYNKWYLKGNNLNKELNLKSSGTENYDYGSFKFIGWIIE